MSGSESREADTEARTEPRSSQLSQFASSTPIVLRRQSLSSPGLSDVLGSVQDEESSEEELIQETSETVRTLRIELHSTQSSESLDSEQKHVSEEYLSGASGISISNVLSRLRLPGNVTRSPLSSSSASDDRTIKRSNIQKNKGKEWDAFKPVSKEGLYHDILMNPRGYGEIAQKWCELYSVNSREALVRLFQLFVDASGFQDFPVREYYKENGGSNWQMLEKMENEPPVDIQITGRYLFNSTKEWGKQTRNFILEFVTNVFNVGHSNNILYDFKMLTENIQFIGTMAQSKIRAVRHTAIVIGLKVITALLQNFVQIRNHLMAFREYLGGMRNFQIMDQVATSYVNKNDTLSASIKYLDRVCRENVQINDPLLGDMRVQCMEEVRKWFNLWPQYYVNEIYVNMIDILMTDELKKVRLAAVITAGELLKREDCSGIQHLMKKFVKHVGGRVLDVDYDVAVAAVNAVFCAINTFPGAISDVFRDKIIKLMYHKNYPLAAASARFVMGYMRRDANTRASQSSLLIKLSLLIQMMDKVDHIPLLVEAALDCAPELQNYDLMTRILLKDDLDFENEIVFIEIMSQSVQQVISGECAIHRDQYRKGVVSPQTALSISTIFLQRMQYLLQKYTNHDASICAFLDILMVLKYENAILHKHQNDLKATMEILESIYKKSVSDEVLGKISKFFAFISENSSVTVLSAVIQLKEYVCVKCNEYMEDYQGSLDPTEDDIIRLVNILNAMEYLFMYHDLNEHITWNSLFFYLLNGEDLLTAKALKGLMTCCVWYLVWELRRVTKLATGDFTGDLNHGINELREKCVNYVNMCFELMASQNKIVHNAAFSSICDVHLQFNFELAEPCEENESLKQLLLKIEKQNATDFVTFLQNYIIIDTKNAPYQFRLTVLTKVLNMMLEQLIPLDCSAKIYKYYNSHYETLGKIFDEGLNRFRNAKTTIVPCIIVRVLWEYFHELSPEEGKLDPRSENAENFIKLAKQFNIFVDSKNEAVMILELAIMSIAQFPEKYVFLYLIKCFAESIKAEDRKVILDYVRDRIPKKYHRSNMILRFTRFLKTRKVAGRFVPVGLDDNEPDETVVGATNERRLL